MNRKIKYSELERENEKLAQDIDEIQHILAVHKNGCSTEDAKKKTTRTSIWRAGGEGPLSGFTSRKSITTGSYKSKLKQTKMSEDTNQQSRKQHLDGKVQLKDAKKQSSSVKDDGQVKMKPHGSNTARTLEKRREWKRMPPRRVSFDIDDDDDSKKDSQDRTCIENSSRVDATSVGKRGAGLETTEDKIAALKVKVLAKASSKVKGEMKKKNTVDSVKKDSQKTLQVKNMTVGGTKCTGGTTKKKSSSTSPNGTKENHLDSQIDSVSSEGELQTLTINKNLADLTIPNKEDTRLVDEIERNDVIGQPFYEDPIRIPCPEILAWLDKFDLDDDDHSNLLEFITVSNLIPDKLDAMTEKDWLDQGLNDPVISIILGREDDLHIDNEENDKRLFTKTDHFEKLSDLIDDTETSKATRIRPHSAKESGKDASNANRIRPHSAKAVSKQHVRATDKQARPTTAIITGKSSSQKKIKKGKSTERSGSLMTDALVISTKTGISKASKKLKDKQEQEEQMKKKKEKEALQRKTERDKMAAHHQKRLGEKEIADKEVSGEYDDHDGSDERKQSEIELSLVAEGIVLLENDQEKSNSVESGGAAMGSSELSDGVTSAKQLAEDQLKEIELQVIGLQQEHLKVGDSSVEGNILRLQQQLSDLQKELRTQPAKESSRSEVKGSPPGNVKKTKKAPDTIHSKTELMREVRKQKEQHRKEIRMLESELSRLKHRDPVKNCELSKEDINFSDEDIIGEGTFSQVFHGKFNGSEVAIKRLKHSLSSSDKNYFAEEVNLLHGLRHPRIVLLIGVCTTGKLPLMVLEYMSSGSLHRYLHDRNKPRLDHVSFYRISKDIALGMTYLHRHKPPVLHLDLKSLNILLNYYGRAKIADFGFSKLKHDAEELSGGLRGTPAWMAPELLDQTLGGLTIKADVYSFGVILWEMLTRATPYKGVGVFQILECIRNNKRPDIPEYCPGPLRALITRCWKQKASQRPLFKEILISLEGLQLPLEWRSLLTTAGIPHEVMEEPDSARSIINLINQSVDISVQELNELSLRSHDEFIKQDQPLAHHEQAITDEPLDIATKRAPLPPPLINLAKFIEEQTKTSKLRPVHSPRGVSKCAISTHNKPCAIPVENLVHQKLRLKSTIEGAHPSQLANLNDITEQKFTSIAEVLRQSVNNRRFAMKMQNDSIDQSTLDSIWSI